jgi:predicted O-methyltransferase YrrM
MDMHSWANPRFAEQLHRRFLESAANNRISQWYFGPRLIALSRFSTNCVSWFGREFAEFEGRVQGDEEEFISVTKPSQLMRLNCVFGDAVVSHFAFHPQRPHLDSTTLLAEYSALAAGKVAARPAGGALGENNDLWAPRLLEAIEGIRCASHDELSRVEFLSQQIRNAGLILDRRFPYGADNVFMNSDRTGLWQIPEQLARCLIELRSYHIERILDVGTASGWTISIIASYLARFNKNVEVITVDLKDRFDAYPLIKPRLPVQFIVGKTAKDFYGRTFDLAFVDGDHSYEGCRSDYATLAPTCGIVALHNIQDRFVAADSTNNGGVPRFWKELKAQVEPPDETVEFLEHSHHDRIMGIGLLIKDSKARRRASGTASIPIGELASSAVGRFNRQPNPG